MSLLVKPANLLSEDGLEGLQAEPLGEPFSGNAECEVLSGGQRAVIISKLNKKIDFGSRSTYGSEVDNGREDSQAHKPSSHCSSSLLDLLHTGKTKYLREGVVVNWRGRGVDWSWINSPAEPH